MAQSSRSQTVEVFGPSASRCATLGALSSLAGARPCETSCARAPRLWRNGKTGDGGDMGGKPHGAGVRVSAPLDTPHRGA
jgi:hypothetical protein